MLPEDVNSNQVDTAKTEQWLHDLSELAMQNARKGNTELASRLGAIEALQHYFHNVYSIESIARADWAATNPQFAAVADRLRRESERQAERDTFEAQITKQVGSLSKKFDKLTKAVEALVANNEVDAAALEDEAPAEDAPVEDEETPTPAPVEDEVPADAVPEDDEDDEDDE